MMTNASSKPPSRKVDFFWLLGLGVAGILLSAVLANTVFDFTVSLSGILCVGLMAIGRREGYLIGLYNSLSYALVAYQNGLFGEVYLNLFFFVPTGIWGYVGWRRHMRADHTVEMRQLTWPQRLACVGLCVLGTLGLGAVLALNPDQNTPFIDASTNVLSVVATFLMVWRYKEQWLLYVVLNVITIAMWVLRVMVGGEASDLMVLMWSIFLLNALFGYWRWHVGSQHALTRPSQQEAPTASPAP